MLESSHVRALFQNLIARLKDSDTACLADSLGGYDRSKAGRLVWGQE